MGEPLIERKTPGFTRKYAFSLRLARLKEKGVLLDLSKAAAVCSVRQRFRWRWKLNAGVFPRRRMAAENSTRRGALDQVGRVWSGVFRHVAGSESAIEGWLAEKKFSVG